jgi:4-hydroxy-tetrahydrodipicolinate reductase
MGGNAMNIAVLGSGAMGNVLAQMIESKEGFSLAGVVEPLNGEKLDDLADVDVVIDFSNPANLEMLVSYCEANNCPAVIATTGFNTDQLLEIQLLATKVPVVFSANYSLGINIMKRVIAQITPVLEDTFDIEIIEKHHNKKLDSPSGTALMLLNAADPDESYDHVFGREGNRKRGKEIGIHAVRGGTIAGEHTVMYAGDDEIIEIKHTANSKKIFAAGAIKAAAFTGKVGVGYYTMEEVLFG